MIMTPPIVGVPVLLICPSRPRLRTTSPTCIFCRRRIMSRPKIRAITMARANDMPALKVM